MIYLTMILDNQSDDNKEKLLRIYQIFKKSIYSIALDKLKNHHEAEDVVHSVIIKIAKNLDKIDEQEFNKAASYIYVITKNCCYDLQRKNGSVEIIPVDLMDQIYPVLFSHYENYFELLGQSNQLAAALDRINEQYAEIVTLRYFHELKIKEISDLLGISVSNASARLHRAICELKKIMTLEELYHEKTGTQ